MGRERREKKRRERETRIAKGRQHAQVERQQHPAVGTEDS